MLLTCGCQSATTQDVAIAESQPKKIIIDTDTGGDDAAAIIMAALQPEIDLLGITVVSGNVDLDQGAKNALMSLEVAKRTDVPVYCGSSNSIAGVEYEIFSVYGKDGMGDAGLVHPSNTYEKEYAVDFILNTIEESPHQVEIVALGPATNIALAIKQDPETMVHGNIKRFPAIIFSNRNVKNSSISLHLLCLRQRKDAAEERRLLSCHLWSFPRLAILCAPFRTPPLRKKK